MFNLDAIYRLTDPTGGCSFLPMGATPLLTVTPTAVSPDPPQGTSQSFTASFRNVSVPPGTPVLFEVTGVNAQLKLVRTDASGQASWTYTSVAAGADTIVARARVNGTDLVSNKARVTWTTGRHMTFLTLNQSPKAGMSGVPVTVSATLSDMSLAPPARVTGASVEFFLGSGSCVGTTDTDGVASCELTPTGGPGTTTLRATFAGSSGFTAADDSATFTLVGDSSGGGDLAGVGPADLWVGLKNSDDVGTNFDVRVEVLAHGTVVARGETLCVTGLVRNPKSAREVIVPALARRRIQPGERR